MFIERIISFVAPHACLVCDAEGELLCDRCQKTALKPLPDRCYRCRQESKRGATCRSCRKQSSVRYFWAVTAYKAQARELIHQHKTGRAKAVGSLLGRLMAKASPHLPPNYVIVPMPTATSHIRSRGYDHARLIARAVARELRLPFGKALYRHDKHIAIRVPGLIAGKHVLLVDDVVISGTSIEEAAQALRTAGAKSVDVLVFAQA